MSTVELNAENFESTVSEQRDRLRRLLGVLVRPVPPFAPSTRGVATHPDVVFGKVDTEAERRSQARRSPRSRP